MSIPRGPWGRTWLLALALALASLAGWEGLLRRLGHVPSVTDDKDLWCLWRERVYGRNAVVLLGGSRIQLGVPPSRLRVLLPDCSVVSLAIDGRQPLGTLKDLTEDPEFSGTIICAFHETWLEDDSPAGQADYVRHYHDAWTLDRKINRLLANRRQGSMASANPYVSALNILKTFMRVRQFPEPLCLLTSEDRTRIATPGSRQRALFLDYRIARVRQVYGQRPVATQAEWSARAGALRRLVEKLGAHRGRIVFVRMPTTGEHWRLDEERYPRRDFWDRFAAEVGAPCIHFRDVPKMARLECYDGSHLDAAGAAVFTESLVRELVRLRVIPAWEATGDTR